MSVNTEPHFIPQISVNGVTSNTVTLGLNVLPSISEYFNYYNVSVERTKSGVPMFYTAYENPIMVDKLKPGATYIFKVKKTNTNDNL